MNTDYRNQPAGTLTFSITGLASTFILIALVAFAGGYLLATVVNTPAGDSLQVFREAHDLVNDEFYYNKPADTEQINGAINGMLAAFKDPYTLYLPPVQAAQEMTVMEGESGGIGAVVGTNDKNEMVITEVRLGWPAEVAGIKVGDVITAVDGDSIAGKTLSDAVSLIRGPLGTEVELTLRRTGTSDPIVVMVKREQINVYGTMLDGKIAYISMSIFSKDADQQIVSQLDKLLPQKPRALIFDLRGNPGGYLDQAIKVADIFLPAGKVASEKLSDGQSNVFNADDGDLGEQIPMVVLVNKGSASASEIVAGALKDRGRAILIGQTTYGKGSVQTIHRLSDGSQLRVTHGAWYTPNETPITKDGQPVGLAPDIDVKMPDTPDATEVGTTNDPVRDAAIEYIDKTYPLGLSPFTP
ncbi:MAG: S41 family peptidase [Anaerolineae bacterium]|nr:S41 family peptidase [Anaerolineae bacterium]